MDRDATATMWPSSTEVIAWANRLAIPPGPITPQRITAPCSADPTSAPERASQERSQLVVGDLLGGRRA